MQRRYRVELSPEAERDIEEIWTFVARDSARNATKYVLKIEAKIFSLERVPDRCAFIPENRFLKRKYRHLVVGKYRIVFRVVRDVVWVARVVHSARLLAPLLKGISPLSILNIITQ